MIWLLFELLLQVLNLEVAKLSGSSSRYFEDFLGTSDR